MARSRLQMTLADYLAILITPVLIMILVGSVVYFLLEIGYQGRYEGRLQWILFWFVVASVLVSRIAIEQGRGAASLYGGGLAAATVLVMLRFLESPLFAIVLLAFIWWFVDRLTVDCTLIDDVQDASGAGLLQLSGLARRATSDSKPEQSGAQPEDVARPDAAEASRPSPSRPTHAPGVWLIYFSLAALPLFGLGQALIPANQTESRAYAFRLLTAYCAAALGLLLTTSFLGLRRYLRQRRIQMPRRVVQSWLGLGILLAIGTLVLAIAIPRPDAEYSATALLDRWSSQQREPSRHTVLKDGADPDNPPGQGGQPPEGEDQFPQQQGGQPEQDAGQQDAGQQGEGQKGEGQKGEGQKGEGQKGEGQKGEGQKEEGQKEEGQKEEGQKEEGQKEEGQQGVWEGSESSLPKPRLEALGDVGSLLAQLVKWLIYGCLAVLVVWGLVTNRHRLLAGFASLWATLAALFSREHQESEARGKRPGIERQRRRFADYTDRFQSGQAAHLGLDGVLRYTFEALEAWAEDWGWPRGADETPAEFARRLGRQSRTFGSELSAFASFYALVAYAERAAPPDTRDCLRRVWQRMGSAPPRSMVEAGRRTE